MKVGVDYSSFTLGVFFQIDRYEIDEFIVGIPDCGGWALEYSSDGLRFGIRCKYMYNIGYVMELGKAYFVAVVYDKTNKNFKVWINTELIIEDSIEQTSYGADVTNFMLGGNWKQSNGHMTGKIYVLNIYAKIYT